MLQYIFYQEGFLWHEHILIRLVKGGTKQEIEVQVASSGQAKKMGEAMCKSSYPGFKVQGAPQPKKWLVEK